MPSGPTGRIEADAAILGAPFDGGIRWRAVARAHEIVGIDLVEVAPDHDRTGSTAIPAAQILMNLLGFVFDARKAGG